MNITITAAAEAFMRRMVRMGGTSADTGFRLSVSPGGCAGAVSEFDVENAPRPGDATLHVNGLRVFLPLATCRLLDGATVDFLDGASASGFRIVNLNLDDCGCGSTTPGRGGRHAAASVSALRRAR